MRAITVGRSAPNPPFTRHPHLSCIPRLLALILNSQDRSSVSEKTGPPQRQTSLPQLWILGSGHARKSDSS